MIRPQNRTRPKGEGSSKPGELIRFELFGQLSLAVPKKAGKFSTGGGKGEGTVLRNTRGRWEDKTDTEKNSAQRKKQSKQLAKKGPFK